MMWPRPHPLHILRVGIAITFLWIGVLILDDPVSWGAFVRPWMEQFLVLPLEQTMIINGWLDIVIGTLLLASWNTWMTFVGALLASLHVVTVLAVVGIDPVTVRDIAILAGSLSLLVWTWPASVWPRERV